MTKGDNSLDHNMFNKLSRIYFITIGFVVLYTILSFVIIQRQINSQKNSLTIVEIAGKQSMLSQKLIKEVLALSVQSNTEDRVLLKNNIKSTFQQWETSHITLQKNDKNGSLKINEANRYFDTINLASKAIIEKLERTPLLPLANFQTDIEKIKTNASKFFIAITNFINQYHLDVNTKLNKLQTLKLWLTIVTLIAFAGLLWFLFLPAIRASKLTFSALSLSEKQAKKTALYANELSTSKEKYTKELRVLNSAIEEALLFARITPTGSIVHMGNKFSQLFNYSKFNTSKAFSETLSIVDKERNTIDNLISKYKKTGWQGEVKGTLKTNEAIWLEMTMIPFNTSQDKSELLIIASEITARKAAQFEIERLTKANFEERINQQKILSSQIIENQEKEQNRIAKDVHDGIGQMLTGLKFNLESIDISDLEKTASKIEYLKDLTANIIEGVRMATFNLTPPELSDYGVVPAINKLTKELSKLTEKNIVFLNKSNFNQRLDSLTEINIYRIIQEAINNAIKYANSTHIIVSLSHSENILSIVIDDNGKGFDTKKIKNSKNADGGMGMTFMKERIKYINGRFFLNSTIGIGTRVTINIPIT